MLEQQVSSLAFVPMVDPDALDAAIAAGVGAEITVDLGGKLDHIFSQPVRVTGRVAAVSQGFVVDLHDRGICDLQRTALLAVGSIRTRCSVIGVLRSIIRCSTRIWGWTSPTRRWSS